MPVVPEAGGGNSPPRMGQGKRNSENSSPGVAEYNRAGTGPRAVSRSGAASRKATPPRTPSRGGLSSGRPPPAWGHAGGTHRPRQSRILKQPCTGPGDATVAGGGKVEVRPGLAPKVVGAARSDIRGTEPLPPLWPATPNRAPTTDAAPSPARRLFGPDCGGREPDDAILYHADLGSGVVGPQGHTCRRAASFGVSLDFGGERKGGS